MTRDKATKAVMAGAGALEREAEAIGPMTPYGKARMEEAKALWALWQLLMRTQK